MDRESGVFYEDVRIPDKLNSICEFFSHYERSDKVFQEKFLSWEFSLVCLLKKSCHSLPNFLFSKRNKASIIDCYQIFFKMEEFGEVHQNQ